ncbi:MAG: STAS domain-containing protein [Ancalomicrobiaceae bacterium]|nr:STAS domain-containing protein [Ancalomicrobiaceae bacterium]
MLISDSSKKGVAVVSVMGRIDSTSSGELEKRLTSLLQRGEKRLILDLSDVDYMASAGLRVLLSTSKKSTALESRLVLAAPNEFIRQILTMTGFISYFSVFDDITAAVAAMSD